MSFAWLYREYYKFFHIPAYRFEFFDGLQLKEIVYTTKIEDGTYINKKLGAYQVPETEEFMDGLIKIVRYDIHSVFPYTKDKDNKPKKHISEHIKPITPRAWQAIKERDSLKKVIKPPAGKYEGLKEIVIIMVIGAVMIATLAIVFGKV